MKLNFRLLIKILTLEFIYFFVFGFSSILFLFLFFGSGAGSSSTNAKLIGDILTFFLISIPIIFNLFSIYKYKKSKDIGKLNSFLIATILFIIFLILFFETYYFL